MKKFSAVADAYQLAISFEEFDATKHSIPECALERLKQFPSSKFAFTVSMGEDGQCYRTYADGTIEVCPTPEEWLTMAKVA
jgi:hypothetical protein